MTGIQPTGSAGSGALYNRFGAFVKENFPLAGFENRRLTPPTVHPDRQGFPEPEVPQVSLPRLAVSTVSPRVVRDRKAPN